MKNLFITICFLISTQSILAQPMITSFIPQSGPVGTHVVISGYNFSNISSENIVYVGGVLAPVLNSDNNSVTIIIPLGATFQPISLTVNGLTAYSNQPFVTSFGGTSGITPSSFAPKVDFNLEPSSDPKGHFAVDIDNDGKVDLITTNSYAKTISILRNTSSITSLQFFAPKSYPADNRPESIWSADFDGDGKQDIAVSNVSSDSISVYRNLSSPGTISLAPKVDFLTGRQPQDIVAADFDKDGKIDIATTNVTGSTVSIFRNTSTPGTLSFADKVDFATYYLGVAITANDFDGDGKIDLAVTSASLNAICLLRNTSSTGSLSFSIPILLPAGDLPGRITNADVDGDGKSEILITYYVPQLPANDFSVTVYKNLSSPGIISFAPRQDFLVPFLHENLSTADMDGDGKLDVVVGRSTTPSSVGILRNVSTNNNISFENAVYFPVADGVRSAIGVDINGDGKPDITSCNFNSGTVSILQNLGTGTLPLTLLEFTAKEQSGDVKLFWKTANEINSAYFEILRSESGKDFVSIGSASAIGFDNAKYNFIDTNSFKHLNFYKLKIVDKDGASTYSPVVIVNKRNTSLIQISVSPNPIQNDANILISGQFSGHTMIELFDIRGGKILTLYSGTLTSHTFRYKLSTSNLKKGIYLIKASSESGQTKSELIIK